MISLSRHIHNNKYGSCNWLMKIVLIITIMDLNILGGHCQDQFQSRQFVASPVLSPILNALRHPGNRRPIQQHAYEKVIAQESRKIRKRRCQLFTNDICLKDPDYPLEQVKRNLNQNRRLVSIMYAEGVIDSRGLVEGVDPIQELAYTHSHYYGIRRSDISREAVHRDYSKEGGFICPSEVKYAKPQRARNQKGTWKTIVNTDDMPQTVRMERCRKPGESCSYISKHFISQCSQVYTLQRLMVFDEKNGIHMDVFRVPSCCSCHVKGYAVKFPGVEEPKTSSSDIVKSSFSFDQSSFPDDDVLGGGVFGEIPLSSTPSKDQISIPTQSDFSPELVKAVKKNKVKGPGSKKKPEKTRNVQKNKNVKYSQPAKETQFKRPVKVKTSTKKRPQNNRPHRFQNSRRPVIANNSRSRRQRFRRPQVNRRPTRGPKRQRNRRPLRNRVKVKNQERGDYFRPNRFNRHQSRFQNRVSSTNFDEQYARPDAESEAPINDVRRVTSQIRFSPIYHRQQQKIDFESQNSEEDRGFEDQGQNQETGNPPLENEGFIDDFLPMTVPGTTTTETPLVPNSPTRDVIDFTPTKRIAVPIPFITPKVNPVVPSHYNYNYHPIIDYMINNKPEQ